MLCTSHIISPGRQCGLFVRYPLPASFVAGPCYRDRPPFRVGRGPLCWVLSMPLCCVEQTGSGSVLKRTSWDRPCFLAPRPVDGEGPCTARMLGVESAAAGQRGRGTLRCTHLPWLTLRAWRSCDQARAGTSLLGRCCKLLGGWCSAAPWRASWGPCLKSAVNQSLLLFHSFSSSHSSSNEQISISSSPSLPPSSSIRNQSFPLPHRPFLQSRGLHFLYPRK